MKLKLKTCDGCEKETVIWKNHEGYKYCKNCWSCHSSKDNTQKPTKSAIPPVSSKRKKKDAEYLKLRERYLSDNPLCMVKVNGCSHNATDVHHKFSGSDRDTYYLVQSTWLAVCRNCHDFLHLNPKLSREMGWLK